MNSICRAKTLDNKLVTGYYLEVKGDAYVLPENAESMTPVRVDKSTVCRYTGLNDRFDKRIFENDLIAAGRWHSRCINFDERDRDDYEPKHETYKEYSGILKVLDGGIYWGVEPFKDLYDCFIEDCADFLDDLCTEYFIENLGSEETATEAAYEFWSKNCPK